MSKALVSLAVGAVIALAISMLAFSLITMFRHEWLYVAEPVVCPEGTTLELRNASPVPGELVLEASCVGTGSPLNVTGKLIAACAGAIFLPSLLLGTLVVWRKG